MYGKMWEETPGEPFPQQKEKPILFRQREHATQPFQRSKDCYSSNLSSLWPHSGLWPAKPGMLMWSLISMMSPTLKLGFSPPAALVMIKVSTPSRKNTRTGYVTWRKRLTRDKGSLSADIFQQKNCTVIIITRWLDYNHYRGWNHFNKIKSI